MSDVHSIALQGRNLAGRAPLRLAMFSYLRTVRSWPLSSDIRFWARPSYELSPGSRASAACLHSTPPRVGQGLHRSPKRGQTRFSTIL